MNYLQQNSCLETFDSTGDMFCKIIVAYFTPYLQSLTWNFIKKGHCRRCFPVNFSKFLKTPLQNAPRTASVVQ